jgi:hypothetical protein
MSGYNYNYANIDSPCTATAVQIAGPVNPMSPSVLDPARAYAQMTTGVSTSVALQNNSFIGAPAPYSALQKGYGAPYVFTPLSSDPSNIQSKSQYPASVNYTSYAASCPSVLQTGANNCGDTSYQMSVDQLMPAGWAGAPPPVGQGLPSVAVGQANGCGQASALGVLDNHIWSAYGPTKQAFERYITSAGAARLGMITRNPNPRITGTVWTLQDLRSQVAVPISASATPWHDADQRQMLYYSSTGYFPQPGTY